MTDQPEAAWNKQQLTEHIALTTHLLQSDTFHFPSRFTNQSKTHWLQLICAVGDLVRQANCAGRRIDFAADVSRNDERQDITSLLDTMRQSAYLITTAGSSCLIVISPHLNLFYGAGSGHFANGLAFTCTYENELTFFVGRERIYFYRHLVRAFRESCHYLLSLF